MHSWNFTSLYLNFGILYFYSIYIFFLLYCSLSSLTLTGNGLHKQQDKNMFKEGVAERLKLLLIHYLRIHHVLVSAPFKQVFKHSLGGKATKSVRGSFFHQLLGSVELHAPREA